MIRFFIENYFYTLLQYQRIFKAQIDVHLAMDIIRTVIEILFISRISFAESVFFYE